MEIQSVGAIKIKDGLFLGDEYAAHDLDFLMTNKITHIINCASKQIPNIFESIGLFYLSFSWLETDNQILFDEKDDVIRQIYNFIEKARNLGESVLVHCTQGLSRSSCVLIAYFMRKFRWNLYKTLEYLHWRRPDLEIRANFFNELNKLEEKYKSKGIVKFGTWNELNEDKELRDEEIIIRNTFLNSKNNKIEDTFLKKAKNLKKIKWIDEVFRDRNKLAIDIRKTNRTSTGKKVIKSCLKSETIEKKKIFSLNFIENDDDITEREKINNSRNSNIRVIAAKSNVRSSSLPKKIEEEKKTIFNNFYPKNEKKKDLLNMSEHILEENKKENNNFIQDKKDNINFYQNPPNSKGSNTYLEKVLKDSKLDIKKQIQNKLLDDKNKKPPFPNFREIQKPMILRKNNENPKENNSFFNEIEFDPCQNANLMSNLMNLNLQLHKQVQSMKNEGYLQSKPSQMININSINITAGQINNLNINIQKPIKVTKDCMRPNSANSAGDNIEKKINFKEKIGTLRSNSPLNRDLLGKSRMRSNSPGNSNNYKFQNENSFLTINSLSSKPKWKF